MSPLRSDRGGVKRVNGCEDELLYRFSPFGVLREIEVASMIVSLRAALEGVFIACFGNSVVDKVFNKILTKTDEIGQRLDDHAQLFLVLKRI
ncbi:hypothetical protein SASPL_136377 [Salvia splendens]|uniref:Uncharacterized protein n=1 Tax=Salvia splendens TaxID=180675 RepID=A0A8X8X0H1_SALSN|nr:hypothetical protein SASPL_136377 [Salvia splendens]